MKSEIGTFGVKAEDGSLELAKLVIDDGLFDVVSLSGEVTFGRLSDLTVMTVLKKGAAVRRLIDAGRIKAGRENYIPAAWLVSAGKSWMTFPAFLESRLEWIRDEKQLAKHQVILAAVNEIIAQEKAAN